MVDHACICGIVPSPPPPTDHCMVKGSTFRAAYIFCLLFVHFQLDAALLLLDILVVGRRGSGIWCGQCRLVAAGVVLGGQLQLLLWNAFVLVILLCAQRCQLLVHSLVR